MADPALAYHHALHPAPPWQLPLARRILVEAAWNYRSPARLSKPRAKARTTEFGARLTTLRKAAGFTQVELAG